LLSDEGDPGTTYFQLELNKGRDVVSGFGGLGADQFLVDGAEFGLPVGLLVATALREIAAGSAVANSPDPQFIFKDDTDELFFDPDGTSAEFAPVFIAVIIGMSMAELDPGDFFVI
jgi:hypothetical protein